MNAPTSSATTPFARRPALQATSGEDYRPRAWVPVDGVRERSEWLPSSEVAMTSASLDYTSSSPLLGSHNPISFTSFLTALSSPVTRDTLAGAHITEPSCGRRTAADQAAKALAPDTAATLVAFARSMAWTALGPQPGPELPGATPPGPYVRGDGDGVGDGDDDGPAARIARRDCTGTPVEARRGRADAAVIGGVTCDHLPGAAARQRRGAVQGICASAHVGGTRGCGRCLLSFRQGLYEGTVRLGSPRNTWYYSVGDVLS